MAKDEIVTKLREAWEDTYAYVTGQTGVSSEAIALLAIKIYDERRVASNILLKGEKDGSSR